MKILVPKKIAQRIIEGLKKAGNQEIGGILMGEHIEAEIYRVKDITLQRRSGSFTWFVRTIESIVAPLSRFFRDTGERFTKFNYLGEWHSHPGFVLQPSSRDSATMCEIVTDPEVGANFAVLIIVKLDECGAGLMGNVTGYLPDYQAFPGELIIENEDEPKNKNFKTLTSGA